MELLHNEICNWYLKYKSLCFSIRYEYLDFSDVKGNSRRFMGQAGCSTWPLKVRFEDTSAINFTYMDDSFNTTSAGYNFKVDYKFP